MTQEGLGKGLGVTVQAASDWECGGIPDAEMLGSAPSFLLEICSKLSFSNLYVHFLPAEVKLA